jgi:hypothetical protein
MTSHSERAQRGANEKLAEASRLARQAENRAFAARFVEEHRETFDRLGEEEQLEDRPERARRRPRFR